MYNTVNNVVNSNIANVVDLYTESETYPCQTKYQLLGKLGIEPNSNNSKKCDTIQNLLS